MGMLLTTSAMHGHSMKILLLIVKPQVKGFRETSPAGGFLLG